MNMGLEERKKEMFNKSIDTLIEDGKKINVFKILSESMKAEIGDDLKVRDVSVVAGDNVIRSVLSWVTKKGKPSVLSVSLRYRVGNQLKSEWSGNPKTKEACDAASTVLDAMVKHLHIVKDENLMYAYSVMLGIEHYRGYRVPELRGVRKKTSAASATSSGPKMADVKARKDEILAKHNELMGKTYEETMNKYELGYDEGCMFKIYGRCKNFLDMLKEMGIVTGYNYWGSSGYTVEFSKKYQASRYYVHEEWEPLIQDLGFKAYSTTYYRD